MIFEIILPIFVMLLIGQLCRRFSIISKEGAASVKRLITDFFLPVALFHAIGTGEFSGSTFVIFIVMFAVEGILFLAGFLLSRFFDEARRRYVPIMMTVFEGGMLGYPLYMNLCGSSNMYKIAYLDIANAVFGLSIILTFIRVMEEDAKPTPSMVLKSAFTSPAFVGTLLGLVFGISGLMSAILASPAGPVYEAIESMVASPLSPLILLVIGYDINPRPELLKVCTKAVFMRFALNILLLIPVVFIVSRLFPGDRLMFAAAVVYFITTPSLSFPSFIKDEDGAEFLANTNSIFIILTLIAYIVVAGFWGSA